MKGVNQAGARKKHTRGNEICEGVPSSSFPFPVAVTSSYCRVQPYSHTHPGPPYTTQGPPVA